MPIITEGEIRNAFHAVQSSIASNDRVTSDMVVQRAINICNEFHITASTLATHWESFSLNHSSFDADKLTSRGVSALRSYVKRQELSRLKREARSLTFRRQSDGNAAPPSPPKRSAPDSSSMQSSTTSHDSRTRMVPAQTFFEMARRSDMMSMSDLQSEHRVAQTDGPPDMAYGTKGNDYFGQSYDEVTNESMSTASTSSSVCPLKSFRVFDPKDTQILDRIAHTQKPGSCRSSTRQPLQRRKRPHEQNLKCICMSSKVRRRIQNLTASTINLKSTANSADKAKKRAIKRLNKTKQVLLNTQQDVSVVRDAYIRKMYQFRSRRKMRSVFLSWHQVVSETYRENLQQKVVLSTLLSSWRSHTFHSLRRKYSTLQKEHEGSMRELIDTRVRLAQSKKGHAVLHERLQATIQASVDAHNERKVSSLYRYACKMRQALLRSAFSQFKSKILKIFAAEKASRSRDRLLRYIGTVVQAKAKLHVIRSWKQEVVWSKNQKQKWDAQWRKVRCTILRQIRTYSSMLQQDISDAFAKWKCMMNFSMCKDRRVNTLRSFVKRSVSQATKRRFLYNWRVITLKSSKRRHHRCILLRMSGRLAKYVLKSSFQSWVWIISLNKSNRYYRQSLSILLKTKKEKSETQKFLNKWRQNVKHCVCSREKLLRAVQIGVKFKEFAKRKAALLIMRSRLLILPRRRARTKRIDIWLQQKDKIVLHSKCMKIFKTWQQWACTLARNKREQHFVRLSRLESVLGKCRVRYQESAKAVLSSAWHTWNTTVLMQQGLEAMKDIGDHLRASSLIRLYLLRSHRSALFQSFYRWREITESIIPAEFIIQESHDKVADAEKQSLIASTLFLKNVFMNSLWRAPLRKAMSRWTHFCHTDKLLEALDNSAWHYAIRANRKKKQKVWTTWIDYAKERKTRHKAFRQLLIRFNHRLMRIAFSEQWFRGDVLMKQRRDLSFQRFVKRSLLRHLQFRFKLWYKRVRVASTLERWHNHRAKRLQTRSLWMWRTFARYSTSSKKASALLLSKILKTKRNEVARRCWFTWWQQAHGGALNLLRAKFENKISQQEDTHEMVVQMHLKNMQEVKQRYLESQNAHNDKIRELREEAKCKLEETRLHLNRSKREELESLRLSHQKICDSINEKAMKEANCREAEKEELQRNIEKLKRELHAESNTYIKEMKLLKQKHEVAIKKTKDAAHLAEKALMKSHQDELTHQHLQANTKMAEAISKVKVDVTQNFASKLETKDRTHSEELRRYERQLATLKDEHEHSITILRQDLENQQMMKITNEKEIAKKAYDVVLKEKSVLEERLRQQVKLTEELHTEYDEFTVKHNEDMQGHRRRLGQSLIEHEADLEALRKRLSSECESNLSNMRAQTEANADRYASILQLQCSKYMRKRLLLVTMMKWQYWQHRLSAEKEIRVLKRKFALNRIIEKLRERLLRHKGFRVWTRFVKHLQTKFQATHLLKVSTGFEKRSLRRLWMRWHKLIHRMRRFESFVRLLCRILNTVASRTRLKRFNSWAASARLKRNQTQALFHLFIQYSKHSMYKAFNKWQTQVLKTHISDLRNREALKRCFLIRHLTERKALRHALFAFSLHSSFQKEKDKKKIRALMTMSRYWARHHFKERCREALRNWYALAAVATTSDRYTEELDIRLQRHSTQFPWSFFSQMSVSLDSMLPWVNPAGGNAFIGKISPADVSRSPLDGSSRNRPSSQNMISFASKDDLLLAADNAAGVVDLLHRRAGVDYSPIDKNCSCYVCMRYSRSHLHHLFKAKSPHGQHLVALHNLHYTVKSLTSIMQDDPVLAMRVQKYFPTTDRCVPSSPRQVRHRHIDFESNAFRSLSGEHATRYRRIRRLEGSKDEKIKWVNRSTFPVPARQYDEEDLRYNDSSSEGSSIYPFSFGQPLVTPENSVIR